MTKRQPMTAMDPYREQYTSKGFERLGLFEIVASKFITLHALYPGSFAHITPSLVIPSVTYADTDRRCPGFFEDPAILRMVENRRSYSEEPEVVFHAADYNKQLPEDDQSFDLLISQWAGPVSQACKRYLRIGGILLANDSHGDASLASLDGAYRLVGIVNLRAGRYRLSEANLDAYFTPKSGLPLTCDMIEQRGRPVPYVKSANAYLFRRKR